VREFYITAWAVKPGAHAALARGGGFESFSALALVTTRVKPSATGAQALTQRGALRAEILNLPRRLQLAGRVGQAF